MSKVFRIDDVSVNTDLRELREMMVVIRDYDSDAEILLAVSPLVHDMSDEKGAARSRVFPKILGAMSDHRVFFKPDKLGVPELDLSGLGNVRLASHGMLHMDHRLLGKEAQEMSIVVSCALVKSDIYVPPFNKYNADTSDVCTEHGIQLVRFEDGWKHVLYNKFDPEFSRYYFHPHDITATGLREWFERPSLQIS